MASTFFLGASSTHRPTLIAGRRRKIHHRGEKSPGNILWRFFDSGQDLTGFCIT
jgi:hypothetical protein